MVAARRTVGKVLILDFGAQYTQLIARRVRETHVYCEIHPFDAGDDFVPRVRAEGHHPLRRPRERDGGGRAPRAGRGVFGSACRCSASATACRRWRRSSAARSRPARSREFGYAEVRARGHSKLLFGIQDRATPRVTACSTCG